MSALAVICRHPGCHAGAGEPCTESGRVLAVYHEERYIDGRQVALAGAGREPPTHRGAWRDRAGEPESHGARRTGGVEPVLAGRKPS